MPERSPSIDKATLKHFWLVSRSFKHDFNTSLLIPVNALCLYTLAPFFVGKILASLAHPHTDLAPYIVGFIIVGVIGTLANRIGFIAFFKWQPNGMAQLQSESLAMLLGRGTAFHNNRVSGKLVSDAVDYPSAFSQLSTVIFTTIIPFAVQVISGLLVIVYSSPLLGLLMLVMTAISIGTGIRQRRKMTPFRAIRLAASKAVTGHLADSVVNIQAVKTFGRERHELDRHAELNDKLRLSRIHDWQSVAAGGTNRIAGLLLFELAFICLTIILVHRNPALLSAGIFAFSYTVTLTNRLFDIGTILRTIDEAFMLAEPMTSAHMEQNEIQDIAAAKPLEITRATIKFRNVSFHYSDSSGQQDIFKDLSISIKAGERVGLVGPSGGGKSTVTKLLLRFEDIQSGTISISGQDIARVTQNSLRQAMAYVPQESLLFHRTIAENIAYGNPHTSAERIVQAAKNAYADEFIMALPDGYDTVVGERGVKLSGGQRQRVAIARAMLKDAPILVLDEATSALDSESERVIQAALVELMNGRTSVVIAHRLSTIQRMDRILVLDKGKVIEAGNHTELLNQDGLYARLWKHQSGGFVEDD